MLKKNECVFHVGEPEDYSDKAFCRKQVLILNYRNVDGKRVKIPHHFCSEHISWSNRRYKK